MSLAVLYTRAQNALAAPIVRVEVHISNGLPAFAIVGMPETAVKESKDRVRAAIINTNFDFPSRRITVNLSPADLPKEGGRYDLPIALGVLMASKQINVVDIEGYEFVGELALTGALHAIRGLLPTAIAMLNTEHILIAPEKGSEEIGFLESSNIFVADHLLDVVAFLQQQKALKAPRHIAVNHCTTLKDFSEVKGQHFAKRALEIAASGGHNLLFIGPPGTGKTMLASRFATILPQMTQREALESAAIASVSNHGFRAENFGIRPFRAPHHTASGVALVGGGTQPRPGEISLAHHGVLFLDELPEFDRKVLEVLREPLESGTIHISRATSQAIFPAQFQLIAAMNPCACGFFGDKVRQCRCTADGIVRYRNRISGPLLDRIDLHVEVPRLSTLELQEVGGRETSAVIAARVVAARALQLVRRGKANAHLTVGEIDEDCQLKGPERALLDRAQKRLTLSPRSYHRILRVARTIADLDQSVGIKAHHLTETLAFRTLDYEL